MARSKRALRSATLLTGAGALLVGLWLLAAVPLVAVLIILAAMACVLVSAAGPLGKGYSCSKAEKRCIQFDPNYKLKGAQIHGCN